MTSEIIGVVGTLLGTVLGWILNNISRQGTLHVYPLSWKNRYTYNNNGSKCECKDVETSDFYEYQLSIDVYNSSADPMIMRMIQVVFFKDRKEILRNTPKDDSSVRRINVTAQNGSTQKNCFEYFD